MNIEEPILKENPSRFVIFPIKYLEIWKMYKTAQHLNWFAEEIDMVNDVKAFEKLNKNEQHFIKMILAFFAASDGIVNENLAEQFMSEIQIPEARCFYSQQLAIENIHSETYSLLLDTLVKDVKEKDRLFNAIQNIDSIKKKASFALKYMDKNIPFAKRLIAFACVEGVQFSSSFCGIFWLKKRGIEMNGLTSSNEFISRDEALHTKFACEIYKLLVNKLTNNEIYDIIEECVNVEKEFCSDALPVNLIGINNELMCQYIEFVADILLEMLGIEKLYKSQNPFNFMEMLSLSGKTNFFEKVVSEYSQQKHPKVFKIDDEF